ncbi:MAG: histidine kinase [Devosia sp.]|uniref:GAF domain-containing sensor histidine kinase n=1 Tax=Devosia sp. TaxID=1871048 RepID=UPI0026188AF0|nr:GAF domain-containing sensor histidine kinase [Devosia sp.]MDB5586820.1 histidine kinase [Devosia sp.]
MSADFQHDIDAVKGIEAVPTILEVVCRTTGMGFAAVARVTEDRWIACQVLDNIDFGLKSGGELRVETTICHEIRQTGDAVVIDHVDNDPAFRNHHTPLQYGFQSYISMPITLPGGRFFGTLCAIDPRPARLQTPEVIGMFKLFAELIGYHLEAAEKLNSSEAHLLTERQTSELREQFIAVLGHDLRNPLASIQAGTNLLLKRPLDDKAITIVKLMQSSVSRMGELIENVLDFARGRLGNGLALRDESAEIEPLLSQVIAELRASWPDRAIQTEFALDRQVVCDRVRIAQLFSNLLGNALTHGAPDQAVRVGASTRNGAFELWVANAGEPIDPATLGRLFQPFYRGHVQASQQGLGLGLYIASQIAAAHGGTLEVTSSDAETRFTFVMPLN